MKQRAKIIFRLVIIGTVLVAGFFDAGAQTARGQWLLSGSGSFSQNKYTEHTSSSSLQFFPKGALFIADNLAVGLMPAVDIQIDKYDNLNVDNRNTYTLSIGPFLRYYYSLSSTVKLFAEGSFSYGREMYKPKRANENYSLYRWRIGPGAAFFLSSSVSLDLSVGYGQMGQFNHPAGTGPSPATKITDFQVGFSVYLPHNK